MDNDSNPSVPGEWRDLIVEVKEFIDDIAWHDSHYSMSKRLSEILSPINDHDNQLPPAPVAEEIISTLDVSQVQVGEKLYTHPQPAVDVDALAEMLWANEKLDSALRMRRQAKNLAIDICNWIEEQQSE